MGRATNEKNCYCHNCCRWFHYLGITNHRKKHLNAGEEVRITYTHGDTQLHGRRNVHWKDASNDTNDQTSPA